MAETGLLLQGCCKGWQGKIKRSPQTITDFAVITKPVTA